MPTYLIVTVLAAVVAVVGTNLWLFLYVRGAMRLSLRIHQYTMDEIDAMEGMDGGPFLPEPGQAFRPPARETMHVEGQPAPRRRRKPDPHFDEDRFFREIEDGEDLPPIENPTDPELYEQEQRRISDASNGRAGAPELLKGDRRRADREFLREQRARRSRG